MSAFCFIDQVTEVQPGESVTAFFRLNGNEEFLLDHFDGFPVMPGVLQLETLKQVALKLLESSDSSKVFYTMSSAEEMKFGQFVKPGDTLKAFVRLVKTEKQTRFFEGRLDLVDAVSGSLKGKTLTALFQMVPLA